jgi:hypothetical protein
MYSTRRRALNITTASANEMTMSIHVSAITHPETSLRGMKWMNCNTRDAVMINNATLRRIHTELNLVFLTKPMAYPVANNCNRIDTMRRILTAMILFGFCPRKYTKSLGNRKKKKGR